MTRVTSTNIHTCSGERNDLVVGTGVLSAWISGICPFLHGFSSVALFVVTGTVAADHAALAVEVRVGDALAAVLVGDVLVELTVAQGRTHLFVLEARSLRLVAHVVSADICWCGGGYGTCCYERFAFTAAYAIFWLCGYQYLVYTAVWLLALLWATCGLTSCHTLTLFTAQGPRVTNLFAFFSIETAKLADSLRCGGSCCCCNLACWCLHINAIMAKLLTST